jgi:hypothetical protein
MASYRLLAPHYVRTQYLGAGEVVSDGPGGVLPSGWVPTIGVDPLDEDAIQRFWNAGSIAQVRQPWWSQGYWGMQGGRWVPGVGPPLIYWEPATSPASWWILTGAGAALGPKAI